MWASTSWIVLFTNQFKRCQIKDTRSQSAADSNGLVPPCDHWIKDTFDFTKLCVKAEPSVQLEVGRGWWGTCWKYFSYAAHYEINTWHLPVLDHFSNHKRPSYANRALDFGHNKAWGLHQQNRIAKIAKQGAHAVSKTPWSPWWKSLNPSQRFQYSSHKSSVQHGRKNIANVLSPGSLTVMPRPKTLREKPKPGNVKYSPAHSATAVFPEHFWTGCSLTMRKGEIMASFEGKRNSGRQQLLDIVSTQVKYTKQSNISGTVCNLLAASFGKSKGKLSGSR